MRKQTKILARFARLVKSVLPYIAKIQKLQEEVNLLTTYSSDTVYKLRYDTMRYEYISPAIVRLLGYTQSEIKSINFRSLILETKIIKDRVEPITSYDSLEKKRQFGEINRWQADYLMRNKNGDKIWVTDISYPWLDHNGKLIGSIGSLRDITERINAELKTREEIRKLSSTDIETGLVNRVSFFNILDQELNHIKINNKNLSIMVINIDGLKNINDGYGYAIGDKIILEMSKIIQLCLNKDDIACRLSGGEFGVFLPNINEEAVYWAADQICSQIAKHRFLEEDLISPLHCTVSIGIASTENNQFITSADLYKQADVRLYIAKHTGRNQVSADKIAHIH